MKPQKFIPVVIVSLASSLSVQAQLLLSDTFNVTTASVDENFELATRQSGTLATKTYTQVSSDFQTQFEAGSLSTLTIYGNNNSGGLSLDHNFTDSGQFEFAVRINPGTADIGFISLGTATQNSFNPTDGIGFRLLDDGSSSPLVQLYSNGAQQGAAISVADASSYNFLITVDTPSAYDGTGTATISTSVNSVVLDLNGAGAGTDFTRTGFNDNYVNLGAFNASGLGYVRVDNMTFTAIPEPSTVSALIGVCALLLVGIRRRRRC